MKKILLYTLIFTSCTKLFAQQDSIARKKFPHFTTYTEAFGSALFYSQNVEFFISNNPVLNFNIRGGLGITDSDEIRAPFLVNAIIGRNKSKFECGIGVMLESGSPAMAAVAGYRHQSDNGLFYRIAFTPIVNRSVDYGFLPWGGLSLGYYFGYRKTKYEPKPVVNLDSADHKLNLIIKADILMPVMLIAFEKRGCGSLTIEKGFKLRHSVQLTGNYSSLVINESDNDSLWHYSKNNGFQLIPEYKYFTGRQRYYTGFYSGAYIKYGYYKKESRGRNYFDPITYYFNTTYNSIAGGISIGYQNYIIKRRMVFDIQLGVGYGYEQSRSQIRTYDNNFIDGRLAFNVGYRF